MGLKTVFRLGAALLVPLLGGCDSGPSVVSNFIKGPIAWDTIVDASKRGPVLVSVQGDPFGSGDLEMEQRVLAHMTKSMGERIITYTTDPAAAPSPGVIITVLFGAPDALNGRRICEGRIPALSPMTVMNQASDEKLSVRMVLCSDGDLLSDVQGWVKDVDGPHDPRFLRLVFDATRLLYDPGL